MNMTKDIDYNSPDLDPEQVYAYLALGFRSPLNVYEQKLLEEIRKIEGEGKEVDIPFDGI
jgi:hypothetical protein